MIPFAPASGPVPVLPGLNSSSIPAGAGAAILALLASAAQLKAAGRASDLHHGGTAHAPRRRTFPCFCCREPRLLLPPPRFTGPMSATRRP